MEETQFPAPAEAVSFPTSPTIGPRKKNNKLIYIIIAFLLVIGVITFLVFKGSGASQEIEVTPTPEESQVQDVATPEPSSSPSATPAATDKEDLKIKVLNGTGVSGEAGYLQGQLKALGYKTIDTGNADSSDATSTEVVFSSSVPSSVVDEITSKLKEIYKSVESSTSKTLSVDIQITTGPRKGVTSTASPKPTATPAE